MPRCRQLQGNSSSLHPWLEEASRSLVRLAVSSWGRRPFQTPCYCNALRCPIWPCVGVWGLLFGLGFRDDELTNSKSASSVHDGDSGRHPSHVGPPSSDMRDFCACGDGLRSRRSARCEAARSSVTEVCARFALWEK
mmetsp:Transcript_5261/g.14943  ORF Transcript_5261/g.14943 Transcript_5261/m.14943 type:complete len:137 (-) Transcript_5261:78-488(-)